MVYQRRITGPVGSGARRCSRVAPLAMRMVPTSSVSTISQVSAEAPIRWRPSRVGGVEAPAVCMSAAVSQGVGESLGEVAELGVGEGFLDLGDDLLDALEGDSALAEQLDHFGELLG